jgi:hypothetical protein
MTLIPMSLNHHLLNLSHPHTFLTTHLTTHQPSHTFFWDLTVFFSSSYSSAGLLPSASKFVGSSAATVNTDVSSPDSKTTTPIIATATVAGVALVAVIAGVVVLRRKRRVAGVADAPFLPAAAPSQRAAV